ncbi:MAG: TolC family protein [Candidatus Tantalella remota]|nr:TolC family protein [Candidatus Tantalella remota]
MAKKALICVSVSVFLILMTCSSAVGRTIKAPREPGEEWEPTQKTMKIMADDPVWDSIRSKEVDLTSSYTLDELIDKALTNNPSTREAWEKARAQDAVATQSNSQWYPKATLKMDANFQRTVSNKRISTINQSSYGPSAEVTWLLLDLGGRSGSDQEARQALLAANFAFNQAIQDLLLDTEKAYYNFYSAIALVKAGEADAADAKATYVAAQEKLDVGLVTKLDLLQAKSSYDDSLFNLEDAKGQLEDARADLATVIGVPADTTINIVAPAEETPPEVEEGDVSVFIEEALKRRPNISAARASLKSKQAAVKVANSDLWPTVNATGAAGYNWYKYYGDLSHATTGYVNYKESYSYAGGLEVRWDIFDGFNNLFKKREAQRLASAEREKLVQSEIAASADVWSKYYNRKTARQKFIFSRAFLDSAEESHALAMEGYEVGLKSILDLLQSQSQLSDARTKFIQSREDLFVAIAEFAHATGSLTTGGDNQ